ncbi:hypothetical protein BT63DRAFT_91818 [Microthyrium microscopicum]|uniref:Uncharacterized protein n=1 Tax=Microthyrium microscopicum TaxID=703497 RepID=A0A6A6U0T7_9PEZI|nr:hypothetical protein BT63DRAFT_91818 [Microthyrium microscopicum]
MATTSPTSDFKRRSAKFSSNLVERFKKVVKDGEETINSHRKRHSTGNPLETEDVTNPDQRRHSTTIHQNGTIGSTKQRNVDVLGYSGVPASSDLAVESQTHSQNVALRNINSNESHEIPRKPIDPSSPVLKHKEGHQSLLEDESFHENGVEKTTSSSSAAVGKQAVDQSDSTHESLPTSIPAAGQSRLEKPQTLSSSTNDKHIVDKPDSTQAILPTSIPARSSSIRKSNGHHNIQDKALPSLPHEQDQQHQAALAAAGLDLSNTVDTTVHTTTSPAVTHETVLPVTREIRTEKITRDIHTFDVVHRKLPVIVTEYLPARHFILSPTGERIEMAEKDIPAALGF